MVTMTSASSTPRTPPPLLTNSSEDSNGGGDDDSSSVESSADSFGAHVALAVWYMSFHQIEALARLAFIRWRLLATV